ncbi:MAG TPA: alpha/beta fold hydrolase [Candidatus Thermoplasmatota archaeon]|nr:alpha/beta fold hydrolase [Candidatus Thermoplasmatota archaeon]
MVALASPRVLRVSAGATAVLLVLGGFGVLAVSHEAAERLIHPARELSHATPSHRGMPYERVAFETSDGLVLQGWWMPVEESRGVVVFLHGYGASKSQSLAVAPFLHHAGYTVLAFDFRAHGESGGTFTSVGIEETKDVKAAVAYAVAREGEGVPLALLGWSMGAAAAINAADELPEVRAIVADSGFARLANAISNSLSSFSGLPRYPFEPLVLGFATRMAGHSPSDNVPERHAANLARPLLVIQGMEDGLARPEGDGSALASAAGDWAQYWLVPGAGHVDARTKHPHEYQERVLAFLDAHLSG